MKLPVARCKHNIRITNIAFCPVCAKAEGIFKVKNLLKSEDFYGQSPAPFIGRYGYPEVNVGILSPPEVKEDVWLYDAPREWVSRGFGTKEVIDYRSSLLNSRAKAKVKQPARIVEIVQEVAIASKPVDVEVKLKERPAFRINLSAYTPPMGPAATIIKAEVTSNPYVERKVEKAVSDTDLKAAEAVAGLYEQGFDENFLSKILSVGAVGLKQKRKLVPTRWSITATDDIIGKRFIQQIRQQDFVDSCCSYFGSYLGNYYLVMLQPEQWSYELFEMHVRNITKYTTDYEGFEGRKGYAESTAGGYYTVRLAVAEVLAGIQKQASALVLRFVTNEYVVPLGVWVTREAARNAMKQQPKYFGSRKEMLEHAESIARQTFKVSVKHIFARSRLLRQRKLSNYSA